MMFMTLWLTFTLSAVATTVTAQASFAPFRLNCGGPQHTDPVTNFVWKGDLKKYFSSGYRQDICLNQSLTIADSTPEMRDVYCCNHFFKASVEPVHSYTIQVLNTTSSYVVRLHFAELKYRNANERVMDISINGKLQLNDFDIVASSSFMTAFVYQTPSPIAVSDGLIKVDFKPIIANAMISAIEVLPAITSPTKAPIKTVSSPTRRPTRSPTRRPTNKPTRRPTKAPSESPIQGPISQSPFVYYRTSDTNILGVPDVNVGLGNPLKGLAGGPRWAGLNRLPLPNKTPLAIEWFNVAFDEIMVGDNQFDWTLFDQLLSGSASRKMHAVFSVYIHWPSHDRPLKLPPHLKDLPIFKTSEGKDTLHYGNERLLTAFRQFIFAWSAHIDGDPRIAALHIGLLGHWGEGHTYPDTHFVPETSKTAVAQWYRDAFKLTHIQARYPGPNAVGFGLYDGSLAYSTLDGAANGGVNVDWFQYPRMVSNDQTNIWKEHMMGGETRPELQEIIFNETYTPREENKQDFKECVDALHLTYAVHHDAFQDGGYNGTTLRNANLMHAYMGYAFYVSNIAASTVTTTNAQTVSVSVTVTQLGVAPFYYDLSLVLQCDNGNVRKSLPGVDRIIQKGDSRTFTFTNVPATSSCLEQVKISLDSSYAYVGRPILFAQGSNGSVVVNIPIPGSQSRSGLRSSALNVAMLQLFDVVKNLVV